MPPIEDEEVEVQEVSLRDQLSSAMDGEGDQSTDDQAPAVEEPQQELDEDGQPRDERGRWTKAQQEHYEQQQREQQAQQEQQPEGELRMAPPHGWPPAAKAAYATLPPEVQEAVARRELEVNNGFRKLQEYRGLDDYAAMARESGTTLKDAFDRYKAAEDRLDANFPQGIAELCQMYNVHPVQLAQTFLQAFGQGGAGQVPQQAPQGDLIARRLAGMEETVRTLISERERAEQDAINGSLEAFAAENMYFEDVRQDMALLIREGRANSLEEAYTKACRMHPEIGDLLIKEQAAPQNARARVDQARRASSGLRTGAPAGKTPGGSSSNSLRDALSEAWSEAQGI
jgi:hypothetical protein